MSDSEDSTVTYIEAPPSHDYVSSLEYPPLPEFVPEPVYPEFMPPEDEVFPTEEQPLPAAVSPTTDSPGYIADSDLERMRRILGGNPLIILPLERRCVSEVTLPPRKRLCIALGQRYEVGESSSIPTSRPTRGFRADYGFVATLDDEIRRDPKRDVGYGITDTWDDMLDIDKIYGRLDDAQDDMSLMSGQLNMLYRDRRAHARAALVTEREARLSPDGDCKIYVTTIRVSLDPASGPAQPEITRGGGALTRWNSHVRTVGHDVAYAMT
ncbi:hypothetical protein Tco_0647803 [Tanacetum coccineum]